MRGAVQSLAHRAEFKVGRLVPDAVQRFAPHREVNLRRAPDSLARRQSEALARPAADVARAGKLRRGPPEVRHGESGHFHEMRRVCRVIVARLDPRRSSGKYAAAAGMVKGRSSRTDRELRRVYSGN